MVQKKVDSENAKMQKLLMTQKLLMKGPNPVVQMLLSQRPKQDRLMELMAQHVIVKKDGGMKLEAEDHKVIRDVLEVEKMLAEPDDAIDPFME